MKFYLAGLALLLSTVASLAAEIQAFKPGNPTILVSATTTSANVTLPGTGGSLLVVNACTVPARIETSGQPAATPIVGTPGSLGVPASTMAVFEIGSSVKSVAVLVDSGSACNVELTRGEGMAH